MTTSTITTSTPLHRALNGMVEMYRSNRDRTAETAVEQMHEHYFDPIDVEAEARSIAYGSVLLSLEPLTASTLPTAELRLLMEATASDLHDRDVSDRDNPRLPLGSHTPSLPRREQLHNESTADVSNSSSSSHR